MFNGKGNVIEYPLHWSVYVMPIITKLLLEQVDETPGSYYTSFFYFYKEIDISKFKNCIYKLK